MLKLPFREPFRENLLPLPGSFRDSVFFVISCVLNTFPWRNRWGHSGETHRKHDKCQNLPGPLPGKPTSPSGKLPGLRDFAMSENCEETPRQIIKASPFQLCGSCFLKILIYIYIYISRNRYAISSTVWQKAMVCNSPVRNVRLSSHTQRALF